MPMLEIFLAAFVMSGLALVLVTPDTTDVTALTDEQLEIEIQLNGRPGNKYSQEYDRRASLAGAPPHQQGEV